MVNVDVVVAVVAVGVGVGVAGGGGWCCRRRCCCGESNKTPGSRCCWCYMLLLLLRGVFCFVQTLFFLSTDSPKTMADNNAPWAVDVVAPSLTAAVVRTLN